MRILHPMLVSRSNVILPTTFAVEILLLFSKTANFATLQLKSALILITGNQVPMSSAQEAHTQL
jgi:hypothetical protein